MKSNAEWGGAFSKMKGVQFPPEAVREIAQLLSETDLGEVTFEARKGARITLKRAPKIIAAAPDASESPVEVVLEEVSAPEVESAPEIEAILVASPCVGVFHVAKDAVQVGSLLKQQQLLGIVESLKVPNEIYAPADGVVAQNWVSDGQGVEWGQPLFEVTPAPQ